MGGRIHVTMTPAGEVRSATWRRALAVARREQGWRWSAAADNLKPSLPMVDAIRFSRPRRHCRVEILRRAA